MTPKIDALLRLPRQAILTALFVTAVAVFCVDVVAQVPPPDQNGPWAVGRSSALEVDGARDNRLLPVDIWYPVDADDTAGVPFSEYDLVFATIVSNLALENPPVSDQTARPLVIYSHGSQGTRFVSYFLTEALASHGFIVAAPDHTGNTAYDLLFGTADPFDVILENRPNDVSFIIDRLLARNADPADALFGRIDPQRIAVIGHSLGGYTSLSIAGGNPTDSNDPRVSVIGLMAPASGLLADEYLVANTRPTLILGGTSDITTPVVPESQRPFELVSGRPVFLANLITAGHQSFTNVCDFTAALVGSGAPAPFVLFLVSSAQEGCTMDLMPIQRAHDLTRLYMVSFLKTYLAGRPGYRPFLTRPYATQNALPVGFAARRQ